jgi:hypothetical protein
LASPTFRIYPHGRDNAVGRVTKSPMPRATVMDAHFILGLFLCLLFNHRLPVLLLRLWPMQQDLYLRRI